MEIVLGGLAVLTAAFLAGVVGFAYGLVALPLLILIGIPLRLVVPINLAIALVARLLVLRLSRSEVSWPRAARLALGAVPGIVLGVAAAATVSKNQLQIAAGVIVLIAVVAIVLAQGRRDQTAHAGGPRTRSAAVVDLSAGAAGGLLGSTTSLNGVPPALLMTLRRVPAREVVPDLAVYFIMGNFATLGLLTLADRVPWGDLLPYMGIWLPVALLGTRLGTWLGPRLPKEAFRRLTLALVVVSAVAGLIDGLSG